MSPFGVALPAATYSTFDRQVQFYQRVIDRFGAMPGVDHVSIVSGLPPHRDANGFGTDVDDYTPRPEVLDVVDYYQTVTAGYFEAMRVPIMRGRTFREADRIGAPVAVVNETFARTFWKDLDPIGRRVRPRFGDETPWVTVVGVAKGIRQGGVDRATGTELYLLLEQQQGDDVLAEVRRVEYGDAFTCSTLLRGRPGVPDRRCRGRAAADPDRPACA